MSNEGRWIVYDGRGRTDAGNACGRARPVVPLKNLQLIGGCSEAMA